MLLPPCSSGFSPDTLRRTIGYCRSSASTLQLSHSARSAKDHYENLWIIADFHFISVRIEKYRA